VEQKDVARMGHLHASLDRFSWAMSDLKKGRIVKAARQLYRAFNACWEYLQIWK